MNIIIGLVIGDGLCYRTSYPVIELVPDDGLCCGTSY
jgi:hypothetical protein